MENQNSNNSTDGQRTGYRHEIKRVFMHKVSWKEVFHRMFSLKEDSATHEEIRDRILKGGQVSGTNMIVMMCAILVASVGLNTNSVAVIIGAMLISPLMGSILAIAYGTATGNKQIIEKHIVGFLFQIGISVLTSTVYFFLSPLKDVTDELAARTEPNLYCVIVAFFGGLAGIVATTRLDKSSTVLPGVAIATAIMPPLCTCGYAIANLRADMLINAAYLFLLNAYFIYLAAELVLFALEVPRAALKTKKEQRRFILVRIRNTVIILLPCLILAFRMLHGDFGDVTDVGLIIGGLGW